MNKTKKAGKRKEKKLTFEIQRFCSEEVHFTFDFSYQAIIKKS